MLIVEIFIFEKSHSFRRQIEKIFLNDSRYEVAPNSAKIGDVDFKQNGRELIIYEIQRKSDLEEFNQLNNSTIGLNVILLNLNKAIDIFNFKGKQIDAFIFTPVRLKNLIEISDKMLNCDLINIIYAVDENHIDQVVINEEEIYTFTLRELEVIYELSLGKTTKETAEELFLSKRTIDSHRRRLMDRFDVKNIIPVIVYAYQNKLLPK